MALQLTFTDDTGVIYTDSYHLLTTLSYDTDLVSVIIGISVYKDKQAYDEGKPKLNVKGRLIHQFICAGQYFDQYFNPQTIQNVNPITQAYLFLKNENLYSETFDYSQATIVE